MFVDVFNVRPREIVDALFNATIPLKSPLYFPQPFCAQKTSFKSKPLIAPHAILISRIESPENLQNPPLKVRVWVEPRLTEEIFSAVCVCDCTQTHILAFGGLRLIQYSTG